MPITSQYSQDIFTLIPMSALSKSHFEQHPLWSEYYDYEEREEIISWGVDPIWLAAELNSFDKGGEHCVYPILRPYPWPDRMRLYIKARFTTVENEVLDGYIMNDDAYILSIFIADEEFVFSRNMMLIDLNQKELIRLKTLCPQLLGDIFPIQYETEFLKSYGNLITGIFCL
jgi:hypothetical protein